MVGRQVLALLIEVQILVPELLLPFLQKRKHHQEQ